jgi:RNase P subunit RPR2
VASKGQGRKEIMREYGERKSKALPIKPKSRISKRCGHILIPIANIFTVLSL